MKCVCGYEKIGQQLVDVPEEQIFWTKVPKKGTLKETKKEHTKWVDVDPQNQPFIQLVQNSYYQITDRCDSPIQTTSLFICPKCFTVRSEEIY